MSGSRITALFKGFKAVGRTALVPYITAGDPIPELTVELMNALVAGGADLIELGVPFSDPEADGVDLQLASERALASQMTLTNVLSMVAEFRRNDDKTPVVLMGYLNPIECMGYERFAAEAAAAGVDAVLVVNLPPEEAEALRSQLQARSLQSIYMIAPTTSPERVGRIARRGSGFLYYVALKGTTGAGHLDTDRARAEIARIQQRVDLPLAVGFGIADGASAKALAETADAVVIGAAVARRIAAHLNAKEKIAAELKAFMGQLRAALG